MKVEDRIRFLLRSALRAEGVGETKVAVLFRRMAEDLRTGESALAPRSPVLGASFD